MSALKMIESRGFCDTLLDLREVKAKSSIYLKVNKTRGQNVSLAIHFFGGTFPLLKEKWARIDDFAIFNPEILLDKFVVPENETVSELDDIIRVTHGDSEGQVLTAGSSRLRQVTSLTGRITGCGQSNQVVKGSL